MVYRIFVEKRPGLDNEARALLNDAREFLGIDGLEGIRLFNRYDVEGVSRPLFDQAIRYAAVLRNRLMTVCAEKAKLEKKLADVRVIDRAKCLLIQYRGLTEEQAHRAIEKQAMDTRQTRVAVAQTVINHYDE